MIGKVFLDTLNTKILSFENPKNNYVLTIIINSNYNNKLKLAIHFVNANY